MHTEVLSPAEAARRERQREAWLNVVAAAAYVGVSVSLLNRLRSVGGSAPYAKIGRRVLYRQADLDIWLDQHKRRSTADTGEVA